MLRISGKYVMFVAGMFLVTLMGMLIFALVKGINELLGWPMWLAWGISLAMLALGLWMWMRGGQLEREKGARRQFIIENGRLAEGEIVFAGEDGQFLVNNRPLYGMAEVTFTDDFGTQRQFIARELDLQRLESSGLKAGDRVTVHYFSAEPHKAIFIWPDEVGLS